MKINLISRNNGVGLSRDVKLLTNLLISDGHQVEFYENNSQADRPAILADANIFVELVAPHFFGHAKTNIMLPNPEWYDLRWRQFLPRFHSVLCKTKSAITTFSVANRNCKFISFTSLDRLLTDIKQDDNQWLHVAGKSDQKGTNIVYEAWAANPDFPHLTILQDPGKQKSRKALPNLTFIYDHISESELAVLQNQCGVHLCPSETEGFGHYIVEAMSAKALVITTNAPPMNELVTPDRGILCDWETTKRQRFATNYYVTPQSLSNSVKKVLSMKTEEVNAIRERARLFYEENDAFFKKTFINNIKDLICVQHRTYTNAPSRRFFSRNP